MGFTRKRSKGLGVYLKVTIINEHEEIVEIKDFEPRFRQDGTPDADTGYWIRYALKEFKKGKRVIIEPRLRNKDLYDLP